MLMKLKVLSLALATGIVFGVAFFLATLITRFQGGGGHIYLMHKMCPCYCVSVGGSFLGLIYGFVYGFVLGGVLAWLYNKLGGAKA
jgi:membrane protease YdiL (CAAX protease family)